MDFTPWNLHIETNLKKNDSATTEAYKTKHFGFYPLKFCSKGNLRDRQAKFSLFGVFDPNQVLKRGPQKMVTDPNKFSSTIYIIAKFSFNKTLIFE